MLAAGDEEDLAQKRILRAKPGSDVDAPDDWRRRNARVWQTFEERRFGSPLRIDICRG
jgi:hypothetical protein